MAKIFENVRMTMTFGFSSIHFIAGQKESSEAYSRYASSMRKVVVSGASAIHASISRDDVIVPVGLFGLQKYTTDGRRIEDSRMRPISCCKSLVSGIASTSKGMVS